MLRRAYDTTTAMLATLLSFTSALLLAHLVGLAPVALAVPSVIFALSLARRRGGEPLGELLATAALFAVLAGVSTWIGLQMAARPVLGSAVFVAVMSLSIWARRFGARVTRMSAAVPLSLIASLIMPPAAAPPAWPLCGWAALVGLTAFGWVRAMRGGSNRLARSLRPGLRSSLRPEVRTVNTVNTVTTAAPKRGLRVSTRMALQMAVSLAAGFAAGHVIFGVHWQWAVLSAVVVNTGTVGRGDVVLKGVERVTGAMAGTLLAAALATALATVIHPGGTLGIILIFVVLAAATLLRSISYAFWAMGITTAMSLLYSYYGQSAGQLLPIRLEALTVGATLAIAVAWLVTPVRTGDVLRGRLNRVLAELTAFFHARRSGEDTAAAAASTTTTTATATALRNFERAVIDLEAIARPLALHNRLAFLPGTGISAHRTEVVQAVRACRLPLHALAREARVSIPAEAIVAANVSALRRSLASGSRVGPELRLDPDPRPETEPEKTQLPPGPQNASPLEDIDKALKRLSHALPTALPAKF